MSSAKTKLAPLLAVVMCVGCHNIQSHLGPQPHTGTIRVEIDKHRTEWYLHAPPNYKVFSDGQESDPIDNMCGYVFKDNIHEGVGDAWIAAVYGENGKGPLLYHTREAANAYVESWCKP